MAKKEPPTRTIEVDGVRVTIELTRIGARFWDWSWTAANGLRATNAQELAPSRDIAWVQATLAASREIGISSRRA